MKLKIMVETSFRIPVMVESNSVYDGKSEAIKVIEQAFSACSSAEIIEILIQNVQKQGIQWEDVLW